MYTREITDTEGISESGIHCQVGEPYINKTGNGLEICLNLQSSVAVPCILDHEKKVCHVELKLKVNNP